MIPAQIQTIGVMLDTTRLDHINALSLKSGSHVADDDQFCLMEAVAYLAGEPHSDHPTCADPVLGAFGIVLNDWMADDERQLLKPLIPKLLNTKVDDKLSLRRAMFLTDAVIRQLLPEVMRGIGLNNQADKLAALEEVNSKESAESAARALGAAAWSAAESAGSAESAWLAAESARLAQSAAESVAESAARPAWSAWSAARSARSAESAQSASQSASQSAARGKMVNLTVQILTAAIELGQ